MPLDVIGAGFGRTGTESMKSALEILDFGPCHHMREVLPNEDQKRIWRGISKGAEPDWDAAFAGYRSAVDWPSAYYWRQTAAHFPDAKILLTLRSAESWYASMEKTILPGIERSTDPDSLGLSLIAAQVLDGRPHDRDHAIAAFERNSAEVQATFGPERLLVHSLGDGWEPLCAFLEVPVPDVPYPHSNTTDSFIARSPVQTGDP